MKQFKSCIQKQVEAHPNDWDQHLQTTALAIRSSLTNSTKFTPAELMLGTKLKLPIDRFLPTNEKVCNYQQRQAVDFAKTLTNSINQSYNIVRRNLSTYRDKMKRNYDKETTKHQFSVGDAVMLWYPYKKAKISRCFQPNWIGPWQIQSITGPSNCKIRNNTGIVKNVHFNQLKPVSHRQTFNSTSNAQLPSSNHHTTHNATETFDDLIDTNNDIPQRELQDMNLTQNEVLHNQPPTTLIDKSWVNLDESNILPHRTRGGGV